MTTPFIIFTQEPDEDITNTPSHYHDFKGAAVRIKVYWTTPIWQDLSLLSHSHTLLRRAAEILKKYTLSLDVVPSGGVGPVVHARIRKKAAAMLKAKLGDNFYSGLADLPVLGSLAGPVIDQFADQLADATKGQLAFTGPISVPSEASAPIEGFKSLRQLIDPLAEENRMIVVFVPISGGSNGFVVRFADWLPWVIVDPRDFSDDSTLLHEMGHACRLAHQQADTIATGTTQPKNLLNIMSYTLDRSRLWGWQVDTMYDSYWCQGLRPKNWWERTILPPDHPFLWEESP